MSRSTDTRGSVARILRQQADVVDRLDSLSRGGGSTEERAGKTVFTAIDRRPLDVVRVRFRQAVSAGLATVYAYRTREIVVRVARSETAATSRRRKMKKPPGR